MALSAVPLSESVKQSASPATAIRPTDAASLTGVVHDARNLVTALRLCAEILAEPGALAPSHLRYAGEIASMAEASAQLLLRLSSLARTDRARALPVVDAPVTNLAEAVRQLDLLLSAMAGPKVEIQTACLPCAGTLRLSEENLTRILLNLVRNAADAMPNGGRIRITAQRGGGASFFWTLPAAAWDQPPDNGPGTVILSVEDNGPGIGPALMERIFELGYSGHREGAMWPGAQHQGLGLSIVRQLVEDAGGMVRAAASPLGGARFEIELPLTKVIATLPSEPDASAGSAAQ